MRGEGGEVKREKFVMVEEGGSEEKKTKERKNIMQP